MNRLRRGQVYDDVGHVKRTVYPQPLGVDVFEVSRDYDPHGYVVGVRDAVTNDPFWELKSVDEAGRYKEKCLAVGRKQSGLLRAQTSAEKHHDDAGRFDDSAIVVRLDRATQFATSRTDTLQPRQQDGAISLRRIGSGDVRVFRCRRERECSVRERRMDMQPMGI